MRGGLEDICMTSFKVLKCRRLVRLNPVARSYRVLHLARLPMLAVFKRILWTNSCIKRPLIDKNNRGLYT